MTISESVQDPIYPVPERLTGKHKANVQTMAEYKAMWESSVNNRDEFFGKLGRDLLSWSKPFETVQHGSFYEGDVAWFLEGELNACYNCVDRHALATPNNIAIIHEGDEPENVRRITYRELLQDVCRLANVLKSMDVRKGDNIAIYMPMVPEAVVAMLACARVGAVHSVVFAGFSSDSLRDRIIDCGARVVLTADEGRRGGKNIATKRIVDEAIKGTTTVEHVLVYRRTGSEVPWTKNRDLWWHDEMEKARPYCPVTSMSSEDPLFLLYTSGSTGTPKGVVHTTAGYLLGAASTVKYIFDYQPGDIHACMADIGWITGHTYIVYGPLALGATTVLFESTPTYPDPSRFWKMVQKHKVTQFYTAPTAIRALRRLGDKWLADSDLSSLRVIGSVGEPINPEAWDWYNTQVGKGKCAVVDTYWQTETGSIIISPLPGVTKTKPGSATFPFFGINAVILDPQTGAELKGNDVTGVLAISQPWPSMARTVYNNHHRYLDTYLNPYKGFYFTGDGASRDKDGYIWIRGRVDDVINVSGHRLSTAEIESALIHHESVAEAAVVGGQDDLTGQCIHAFATLKPNVDVSDGLERELSLQVRKVIGPFATPKRIYVVSDLPKTRSGKIMRRILRKIVNGEHDQLGDISTLADPSIVEGLIVKAHGPKAVSNSTKTVTKEITKEITKPSSTSTSVNKTSSVDANGATQSVVVSKETKTDANGATTVTTTTTTTTTKPGCPPVVSTTISKETTGPVVSTITKTASQPVVTTTTTKETSSKPVVTTTTTKETSSQPVVVTTVKESGKPAVTTTTTTTTSKDVSKPAVVTTTIKEGSKPGVTTTTTTTTYKESSKPEVTSTTTVKQSSSSSGPIITEVKTDSKPAVVTSKPVQVEAKVTCQETKTSPKVQAKK